MAAHFMTYSETFSSSRAKGIEVKKNLKPCASFSNQKWSTSEPSQAARAKLACAKDARLKTSNEKKPDILLKLIRAKASQRAIVYRKGV